MTKSTGTVPISSAEGNRYGSFSPRTGANAASVLLPGSTIGGLVHPTLTGQLSSSSLEFPANTNLGSLHPPSPNLKAMRRRRSHAGDQTSAKPLMTPMQRSMTHSSSHAREKAQARVARKVNDAMVYLDGPQIYTCAQCRTHFTSHDEIISKSFHGRHGRAFLFDNCANITVGPAEDRPLITGLHSVCDIFCKRCKTLVGWTYARAYEPSQKYKEGKYIIEKINLHLETSDFYDVAPPAGERRDRCRSRSISWGSDSSISLSHDTVFEYSPSRPTSKR